MRLPRSGATDRVRTFKLSWESFSEPTVAKSRSCRVRHLGKTLNESAESSKEGAGQKEHLISVEKRNTASLRENA
jgi:hypothetical protein